MALVKYNTGKQVLTCKRCGVELVPGTAIENTMVGDEDFIGSGEVVTVHPGGKGRVIACLKCPDCGYSVYPGSKS